MKKKAWVIAGLCVLAVALTAGAVFYFGFFRPRQQEQQLHKQQVQQYRAEKMDRYLKENAEYEDYEVEVAFIGDSLTDLYDLEKYYPQYITANRGVGGDTTFDLEKRLPESVYALKPKVVVMLIGANNMETMLQNYESILIGLRDNLPETKVVLLSLTAMGGEHWGAKNQLAAYNNVTIKLLAEKYGYTYIDLFSPLYDPTIGEVCEGYTIDGGHFTHEGYTVLTQQITPVLEELLGK